MGESYLKNPSDPRTPLQIVCKKPAQDPAFKTIVSGAAAQPKKEIEEIVEEKIKRPENGSSSKLGNLSPLSLTAFWIIRSMVGSN